MKEYLLYGGALFLAALALLASNLSAPFPKHHGRPTPTPTPSPTPAPPQVTLAWDPSSGATDYKISIGFASGAETTLVDAGSATEWTLTLSGATTYYFVVFAYNSAGPSLPSNEVSYTTP